MGGTARRCFSECPSGSSGGPSRRREAPPGGEFKANGRPNGALSGSQHVRAGSQNAHLRGSGGAKRRQEGGSRQTAPLAEPFLRNTTSRGVSQIGGFKANGRPNGALSGKQHPGAASQNAHLRHTPSPGCTPSPSYHPLPTIPITGKIFESFLELLRAFESF